MAQQPGRELKTLKRAFDIIDAIEDLDGATVTQIAQHLDISPGTAHGYLTTLEQSRYLVQRGDEYNIGMKFLCIGGYASAQIDGYKFIKQKIEELAEKTGERAQFIVEEHGLGIYVYTVTANSAVEIDAHVGKERRLHASAAGKSILAHMPEEKAEEIIDRWGLPPITDKTITERDELERKLDQIREDGYSQNMEESVQGLRAVGAPIEDAKGQVLGALSVSAPSKRMQGERLTEDIPMHLLGTTNEIELKIVHTQG